MKRPTRLFLGVSLAALVGAALLHLLVLLGWGVAWNAMVHLVLFGWITGMIVTVNSHAMPVFSARDFPEPRVLLAQGGAMALGLAAATAGLLLRREPLVIGGLALELLASLLILLSIIQLFARGKKRAHGHGRPAIENQAEVDRIGTRATMVAGLAYPLAMLSLLAARLASHGEGWLAAEHLATLGWVMGMIIGVGLHVLPRFSGRGVRSARLARGQLGLHVASLVLMVPALAFGWSALFTVGAALMGTALALFGWNLWPTLRAIAARPAVIPVVTIKEAQP